MKSLTENFLELHFLSVQGNRTLHKTHAHTLVHIPCKHGPTHTHCIHTVAKEKKDYTTLQSEKVVL